MKLVKNYLFNLSYQIFSVIIPIATVPYISRVLGPNAIGINAYTNSIMTYFVLFANLGLNLYGNRTIAYYRNDIEERNKKFWEIVFLKIGMMLLSYGALLCFLPVFEKYKIFLIAQSVQLIAVGVDISWFFVGIEDFKKTVTRNFIVKIVSLICIFSFVKTSSDLTLYILFTGGSVLLGNLSLWTYMKRFVSKVRFSKLKFGSHILPVLALFLPQLATTIFTTLNRLLLGNLSTLSQTGYFDNSDKIVRVFLTVTSALGTVLFPRMANAYKNCEFASVNRYLDYSLNLVSMLSFPIAFGIIGVSAPFSNLFFGKEFDGINLVLSILAIELIFMGWSSIIGQQYLVAVNRVRGLTVSMVISIVIAMVGSLIFIPTYGAMAAAMMSVVAELVIVLVQIFYVRKDLDLKYLFRDIWKFLLASIIMLIVCSLVGNSIRSLSDISQLLMLGSIGVLSYGLALTILRPNILIELKTFLKKKIKH